MSSNPPPPTSEPSTGSTPPSSGRGNNRRRKGKDKSNQKGSGPKSSPTDPSLGFSEGAKVLEQAGLSISGRVEDVPADLRTEGYFHCVQIAYQELIHVKSELQDVLSFEEWRHIHALLIYHRLQEVYFKVQGIKQPARTRTPVPYDTRVFQPIWALLSEIGVVLDPELAVRYYPVAKMPTTEHQETEEEITEILDCVQYPWHESWVDARAARTTRLARMEQDAFQPETIAFTAVEDYSKEDWDNLRRRCIKGISSLKKLEAIWVPDDPDNPDPTAGTFTPVGPDPLFTVNTAGNAIRTHILEELTPAFIGRDLTFDSDVPTTVPFTDLRGLKDMRDELIRVAKDAKERKITFKPRHHTPAARTFDLGTVEYQGQSGAYGAWLGSDGQLWTDYHTFCDIASPVCLFSISFPKEMMGTYAWLIRREEDESGFFVKMPKRSIGTVVWMTGLLFDMGNLPTRRTITWYAETDRANSFIMIRLGYIKAAIKSGAPVETFR